MALTPLEINTAARERYNAVNDDFWSDSEIYMLIYQGLNELVTEGFEVEQSYSTTSVASQQEYAFPTQAMNIKRLVYNGKKLVPITFREDDVLTNLNSVTLSTGLPTSYAVWNNIIYMRPIPDTTGQTIQIFCNIEPQTVTSTSTIEIAASFQTALINYVLSEMSAKNKNFTGAAYYRSLWKEDVLRYKRQYRKSKRGDAFRFVQNVDIIPQTDLGNI